MGRFLYFWDMLNKKDFIPAGSIAKPHGVSGEVAIRINPDITIREEGPEFIFADIEQGLVPFRVGSFRYKSENVILVSLPLLTEEEKIKALVNHSVYLSPEDVGHNNPELTNLNAFTGYKLKDKKEGIIGEISGIQDISNNPLFIVEGPGGEILIPVAEDLVVRIDDEARIVEMEIPEGLVDMNEE
ncbi:MAG: 16S rRNA processing protein RimM [Marinilabilia sp.]